MRELRPYLRLLRARSGRLGLGAVLMLATTLAGTGLLALSGWFITAAGAAAAASATALVSFEVYTPGGAIRGFALGRTAARYGERIHNHDAVLRILADLRTAVFARLTRLDPLTLARFRAADVLSRLTGDIDALDALYLRALAPPVVGLLGIAAIAGLVAWFAPVAGLAVGGLLLGLWLVLVVGGWLAGSRASERLARGTEVLRGRVLERVEGLSELISFGTLARHQRQTEQVRRARAGEQQRLEARYALGEALATAGVQAAGALALVSGVVLHQQGVVSVAVVVLMTLAPVGLSELLGALPGGFIQLGRSRAAAVRLNEQVDAEPAVTEPSAPRAAPEGGELRFEAVRHRYHAHAPPVLGRLDLTVAAGGRVAVVGRSGSGKSTLGALALRLMDPEAGVVRIGGTGVHEVTLASLRQRVGYLTQSTELLDASVAANLRIAAADASDEALYRALGVAGLEGFVRDLPRGLYTGVGQGGSRLSGGQARRLSLARIVLREPSVVVLDEPLAGLDAATAAAVSQRLETWLDGRTVLMLGHDSAALPTADRVVTLSGGTISP